MKFSSPDIRIFLLLLFFPLSLFSQIKDFQTWNSITIQKSFTKKLDGIFGEELRLQDNCSQFNTSFTDAGLKYELFKNFAVEVYLRFIINPDDVAYRPYTDLSYKLKLHKWYFAPRLRYQHQWEQNKTEKNYFRPKLTISYKINRHWEPYVSGELFYHAFYYKGDFFDEYRASAGIEHDFNNHHSLKLFYLFDQEFNVNAAEENHVAGAAYEIDF